MTTLPKNQPRCLGIGCPIRESCLRWICRNDDNGGAIPPSWNSKGAAACFFYMEGGK